MKQVYNTRLCWKCVIRKVKKVFSKRSGLKFDYYCQEYIYFLTENRKNITPVREKVLILQKPVQILKKNQNINPR